jgi:hypothetical protein
MCQVMIKNKNLETVDNKIRVEFSRDLDNTLLFDKKISYEYGRQAPRISRFTRGTVTPVTQKSYFT